MHVVPIAPHIDPTLVLTDGVLKTVFAPATLEAGRIYELRGRVRELRIEKAGALICAETQGTAPDPYTQRIAVARRQDGKLAIAGMCSCPVGRDCKHVAAVLVAAHREELTAGPATPAPEERRSDPRAMGDASLPYDLAGWLSSLSEDEARDSEDYPPSIHQRIHYVLNSVDLAPGGPKSAERFSAITRKRPVVRSCATTAAQSRPWLSSQ